MSRIAFLLAAVVLAAGPARSVDEILPPQERVNGKEISGLFEAAVPDWRASTVEILGEGGAPVALGVIVDDEARLVVTKASETRSAKPRARLPDGAVGLLETVGVDRRFDVALLRLGGTNKLVRATLADSAPAMGAWIASATGEAVRGVRLGVVSAARREIERTGGVLGVILGRNMPEGAGVMVAEVMKDGGASAAGIRPGDIISAIDGQAVATSEDLRKLVFAREPGDVIDVMITRGDSGMARKVTLGHRGLVFAMFNRNQAMSGETSKVKAGFPDVFQHATLVSARAMGGPVFDLDGRVAGINIARVNRTENYAIPADTLRKVVDALRNPRAD
ncbi:MAG: PDZ domain-containing protein [Kiritimatiellia bacterium]